jgi:rhodanese-related sulfurtransferase
MQGYKMFAKIMGLKTVAPDALVHLLKQGGDVAVIDVNSPQSWAKARVPGARNLDPVTFADIDLPADRNALLVFYCSNPLCRKAPNAARRAKRLGYLNVRVMSAGISGWITAQHPTESGA